MVILEKHFPFVSFSKCFNRKKVLHRQHSYYQNQLDLQFLFITTKGALIQVLGAM